MHPDNAMAPNTFFAAIGLLERQEAGGYAPSPEVVKFARAHQWNADTAGHKLAPALERSWFGQTVLPIIKLRPRPESEVIAELASASAAPPEAKPLLGTLLEYLQVGGLIRREGGAVRLTQEPESPAPKSQREAPPADPPQEQPPAPPPAQAVVQEHRPNLDGVSFSVTINVSVEKMKGWSADRIGAFFSGLAQVIAADRGGAQEKPT
jgi:hypothetical protein